MEKMIMDRRDALLFLLEHPEQSPEELKEMVSVISQANKTHLELVDLKQNLMDERAKIEEKLFHTFQSIGSLGSKVEYLTEHILFNLTDENVSSFSKKKRGES
jgi:hypothetical protein